MTRLLLDPADFAGVIDAAVEAMAQRLESTRTTDAKLNGLVMFRPESLREWAARKEATATDTAAQTWDGIVATMPTLAELEQHLLTMRVATSTPEYGRDWLEILRSLAPELSEAIDAGPTRTGQTWGF